MPLHERDRADAIGAFNEIGLGTTAITTRQPALDDVYLRLTGDRLAEAA